MRVRCRQGFAFFQEQSRQVLECARDHEPGIGQVESLADRARKIEGFGHYHLTRRSRKVERHMVAEHT